jgi:hypothetical protein
LQPLYARQMKRWKVLSAVLAISFFPVVPASAQARADWVQWFGPKIGGIKPAASYSATGYATSNIDSQQKDFRLTEHNAVVFSPIRQDDRREWSAAANVRAHDVKTDAVLPDTGEKFPGTLWDIRAGTMYRQRLDNGWIGGGTVSLGSASDKPFSGSKETEVQATAFARKPDGPRNAWLFLLTYSNNREFLNNIPFPTFGYWYEPSDRYRLIVGIPFGHLDFRPTKDLSFTASYLPVRTIHAAVSYRLIVPLKIYSSFDWRHESWFRRDRSDDDFRFFYYEKRIAAGIQWEPGKSLVVDLSGGYAFDRFYFEGKDYGDRGRNRVDVNDGPVVAIRAGYSF